MIKRKMEKGEELGDPGIESFTDDQTGEKYRRIVGGLAWPHNGKPGFAVVLGEDFEEDRDLKGRHLWVLKELEAPDAAELIRRCQDLRDTLWVRDWFGNTSNGTMLAVLYHLQKGLDSKRRFSFDPADHADDPQGLGYYLHLIKESLGINRKLLHFGEGSSLPGYLAEMGTESLNHDPSAYPPIAALGYALSHLYNNDPVVVKDFRFTPPFTGAGSWM